MTVTTLDPATALVVVDLQKGIAGHPAAAPIIANAARLADAFRAHGLPVVLVNVDGTPPGRTESGLSLADRPADWSEVLPELGDGIRVTKTTWSAFPSTDLDERLRALGVTQVVILGVATSFGVESTARSARDLGYHVTLAVDAMLDPNPDAHALALTYIFPRIGETGTTDEIVDLVEAIAR